MNVPLVFFGICQFWFQFIFGFVYLWVSIYIFCDNFLLTAYCRTYQIVGYFRKCNEYNKFASVLTVLYANVNETCYINTNFLLPSSQLSGAVIQIQRIFSANTSTEFRSHFTFWILHFPFPFDIHNSVILYTRIRYVIVV